jgi:hypothetical protein
MAANSAPIFSRIGVIQGGGPILTAMTGNAYDGTATQVQLVFTADSTNGGYIQRLRFKAVGTNIATVARVFINNGSAPTTAANNDFYGEVSLPAITATATAATVDIDYPMNIAMPPGYRIYVGVGTTVASGWFVTSIAGAY